MMARYIDAEQLKRYIQETTASFSALREYPEHIITKAYLLAIKHVTEDIDYFPAADVVEVVRCKDCKHWGGVTFGYVCNRFSGAYIRNETRETDFCSYGVRKENG